MPQSNAGAKYVTPPLILCDPCGYLDNSDTSTLLPSMYCNSHFSSDTYSNGSTDTVIAITSKSHNKISRENISNNNQFHAVPRSVTPINSSSATVTIKDYDVWKAGLDLDPEELIIVHSEMPHTLQDQQGSGQKRFSLKKRSTKENDDNSQKSQKLRSSSWVRWLKKKKSSPNLASKPMYSETNLSCQASPKSNNESLTSSDSYESVKYTGNILRDGENSKSENTCASMREKRLKDYMEKYFPTSVSHPWTVKATSKNFTIAHQSVEKKANNQRCRQHSVPNTGKRQKGISKGSQSIKLLHKGSNRTTKPTNNVRRLVPSRAHRRSESKSSSEPKSTSVLKCVASRKKSRITIANGNRDQTEGYTSSLCVVQHEIQTTEHGDSRLSMAPECSTETHRKQLAVLQQAENLYPESLQQSDLRVSVALNQATEGYKSGRRSSSFTDSSSALQVIAPQRPEPGIPLSPVIKRRVPLKKQLKVCSKPQMVGDKFDDVQEVMSRTQVLSEQLGNIQKELKTLQNYTMLGRVYFLADAFLNLLCTELAPYMLRASFRDDVSRPSRNKRGNRLRFPSLNLLLLSSNCTSSLKLFRGKQRKLSTPKPRPDDDYLLHTKDEYARSNNIVSDYSEQIRRSSSPQVSKSALRSCFSLCNMLNWTGHNNNEIHPSIVHQKLSCTVNRPKFMALPSWEQRFLGVRRSTVPAGVTLIAWKTGLKLDNRQRSWLKNMSRKLSYMNEL